MQQSQQFSLYILAIQISESMNKFYVMQVWTHNARQPADMHKSILLSNVQSTTTAGLPNQVERVRGVR